MKNLILLPALAIAVTTSVLLAGSPGPLQSVLDKYIQIQTALAGDSLKGVAGAATDISAIAKANARIVPEPVAAQSEALAKASDIKAAREAFKPLSAALIAALSVDKSVSGQYYEAFCPMAKASWIQVGKKVANPYFGASMSGCGEIRKSLGGQPQANADGNTDAAYRGS